MLIFELPFLGLGAVLRRLNSARRVVAKFSPRLAVRSREPSSSKETSSTQWSPLSMLQCTLTSSPARFAVSAELLVI